MNQWCITTLTVRILSEMKDGTVAKGKNRIGEDAPNAKWIGLKRTWMNETN